MADVPALDPTSPDPTSPDATSPDSTAPGPLGIEPDADRASRRRARWGWWLVGAFVLVAVIATMWLGRQSESDIPPAPKAFCKAANAYEEELGRQQVAYKIDTAKQIEYVEEIAATAPEAVRADAELFLASLRKIDAASTKEAREKLQDDPDVEHAVENVNRYWNQGCGVFDRQSGL